MNAVQDNQAGQAMLSYIEAARPVQVLLQQTLTQVSGYSLMLMTNGKPASRPEGALLAARATAERAHEQLRALRVPAGAEHHHHHLLKASDATRMAFTAAETCAAAGATEGERETLVRTLYAANEHLRATSRLLPGFETIDFGQACCAWHAGSTAKPRAN